VEVGAMAEISVLVAFSPGTGVAWVRLHSYTPPIMMIRRIRTAKPRVVNLLIYMKDNV